MYAIAVSFFTSLMVLFLLLKTRLIHLAMDTPNQRSLHSVAIPRSGGLAIMAGVMASLLVMAMHQYFYWLLWIGMLVAISIYDDIRDLSVLWRLLGHVVVSVIFICWLKLPLPWWALLAITPGMVWIINLYNFMDGSDGLAGGMAAIGFSAYALVAYAAGDHAFTIFNACIVAASLAFLGFNFHPARIFMGDAGSVPLGFLVGAMGIYGWQHALWSAWFPLLVFSPFIMDASVTLLKRLLGGEKIWQAHRCHYYQRLVQMGWGHRNTALAEYLLMTLLAGSALFLLNKPPWLVSLILLLWIFTYLVLMSAIDRKWLRAQQVNLPTN